MSHVTRENGMGELLVAVIVFFSLSLHRPGFYEEFVLVKVVDKETKYVTQMQNDYVFLNCDVIIFE